MTYVELKLDIIPPKKSVTLVEVGHIPLEKEERKMSDKKKEDKPLIPTCIDCNKLMTKCDCRDRELQK